MQKICDQCSRQYNARLSRQRFCGQECYRVSRIVNDRKCLNCDKVFSPASSNQLYCSRSCSATVNNRKYPKRVRTKTCNVEACEVLVGHNTKYCEAHRSHRRQGTQRASALSRAEYIDRWLNGQETGSQPKTGAMSKKVRNYLLEEAGHKCTKCGWCEPNPVTGKPILCIDHIDGNWKNNARENLIVLCYNCHTLTPTFNALNIGNGQGVRGSGPRTSPGWGRLDTEHSE